ncbi:hypothetical protein [Pseudomonas putida]|uniref:Uncharacterized protein n=1 Tax=Pseudomonas putida TaxID=303 RepID=A0A8I1ECM8_PSEPU|nr:hypothetical protein [Pseudomonas putida]MBI6883076.1 hypothetical protein [Pseudomonas putida]
MKIFARSESVGRRWVHPDMLLAKGKGGQFVPVIMRHSGLYPCCPISWNKLA